jgi:hypothetical protein
LVLFDRLSPSEQQALSAVAQDPECYGILRPRDNSNLSMKSVSRDTALLLFTLQTPNPLPNYAIAALGDRLASVIEQMVMDRILEIEAHDAMLSGPAAFELLFGKPEAPERESVPAALSRRALEYAEALEISETLVLSQRLYAYNRLPASASWRRLWPDESSVERHLGLRNGGDHRVCDSGWVRMPSQTALEGWTAWQSRGMRSYDAGAPAYKLYISPTCSELGDAFQTIAEAIFQSPAFHWKVGSNLYGLLRPDKIVVHFSELADLQTTADRLAEKLHGCSPQGVPFTAEISPCGLLSWGLDPPVEEHVVPWLERESWRSRICNRLAAALVVAKTSYQSEISRSRFALERLKLEGIDTNTWAPTTTFLWSSAGAS